MPPFSDDEEGEKHKIYVDPVGLISEILNNIDDDRDIIRELLSNSAAKEVGATKIEIKIYASEYGLAIKVTDNGRGMNYTKDLANPGRLDKFLNAAQGRQAGFESDEFGAKGFGSKLLYNSEQVVVETWDGGEYWYRVLLNSPRKSILDEKKLVEPIVEKKQAKLYPTLAKGTSIEVKGWAGIKGIPKYFNLPEMERFLRYFTVAGYTKGGERLASLPVIELEIGGAKGKTIQPGFPYISETSQVGEDSKTIVLGPITKEKTTPSEKRVRVTIKGGITTDTSRFGLTDLTGGVFLSVNGIPYFQLDTNKYARKLNFTDDFVRFVAECDDIHLNLSRGDLSDDDNKEAFEDALNDIFSEIKNDQRFQKFYQNRYREARIEVQAKMNKKKEEFASDEARFVWLKGNMILCEPKSEYDTAALLWILEGMNALPFAKFKTLQYPGYREGIDALVNFQEASDKEEKMCAYAEIERLLSNLVGHKHDIGQMTLAICWEADSSKISLGKVLSTNLPFKRIYQLGDASIPVIELSKVPGIYVGTRSEAREYFGKQAQAPS